MLAVDLDVLAERGRAVLAERERAGLPAPPDLAGEVLASVNAEHEAEWAEAGERYNAEAQR